MKFIKKLQNEDNQRNWNSKILENFYTFCKILANWPSSGCENWMHNIILKISEKLQNGDAYCIKPKNYQKFVQFLFVKLWNKINYFNEIHVECTDFWKGLYSTVQSLPQKGFRGLSVNKRENQKLRHQLNITIFSFVAH